jgi:putative FmdB family regulatory protein
MPIYVYQCLDCDRTFERTESMKEHEEKKKPSCPECKGEQVEQRFRPFFAKTRKKS